MGETLKVGRISFPNGWDFDIHDIRHGEVFYQRWPPDVENQSIFCNLTRTPLHIFALTVAAEGGQYIYLTAQERAEQLRPCS